jgi:MFS transporter, FSR family, fosmidomycin resistance protein
LNTLARRRATLGTCGVGHFLHDGFSDVLFVLFPLWTQEFGLSLTQVGLLKTAFSGVLAGFQVPAGFLAERWGERRVLVVGTAITGLAFIALGWAGGFLALAMVLVVAGLGSGTQHPLSATMVSRAYEEGPRRAALGILNFTGDLGKAAIPALIALGAGTIGWRPSVMTYGAFGMVVAIGLFVALGILGAGAAPVRTPTAERKPRGAGWGIHHRRGFTVLSIIGIIDFAARSAFLTFVPFLLIAKGVAVENVGFALALVFAGGAAGKFLCGVVAERLGIIRTVVITELVTSGCILVLLVLPLDAAMYLLPLTGLALNGTSSVLYGTVPDFVTAERQARAFGLFYTLVIGAGAVSPFIFGLVSDGFGVPVTLTLVGLMVLGVLPLCWLLSRAIASVRTP